MIRLTPLAAAVVLLAAPIAGSAQKPLDEDVRAAVLKRVLDALDKGYVFPDVAAAMARAARTAESAGKYRTITDPQAYAQALTEDLRAISHDGHLRVVYRTPGGNQQQGGGPPPQRTLVSHERLEGNIGYIKLLGFPPPQIIGPPLDAAFSALANTDALIVDLRENGGGAPTGAMYLAGYLMKQRTLMARIYSRPDNETTEMWTEEVKGARYLDKPVYVLTSRKTFSAAEAAAYHLKHIGRVQTVGDTTGGGAHRINGADVGNGFMVSVPMTRPINVVTGGDWEGTGVIPDIAVPAERALVSAQLAALRKLPPSAERAALIRKLGG